MSVRSPADLAERCQPIELLVSDVDGVMTDGIDRASTIGGSRPSISTFATAWHFHFGTKPANMRRFSRAGKRLAVDLRAAELEDRPCAPRARTEGAPASYSHRTTRSLTPASLLRRRRPS